MGSIPSETIQEFDCESRIMVDDRTRDALCIFMVGRASELFKDTKMRNEDLIALTKTVSKWRPSYFKDSKTVILLSPGESEVNLM